MQRRRRRQADAGERQEMERPKWEDLDTDCLVNIFSRVGMENLLLDVPYVCKSWYKATCNPQCWTTLNFTKISEDDHRFYDSNFPPRLADENKLPERLADHYKLCIGKYGECNISAVTSFVKNVVKRSNGLATFVKLPSCCTPEAIVFLSNECPNLKTLKLPFSVQNFENMQFPSLVSKWKSLEKLRLCSSYNKREILAQIGTHCNKFEALEISEGRIREEEASGVGTFLPNLKVLSLRNAYISKEDLLVILNCCKNLEVLDARDCVGFEEDDDDILKSAAHIPRVKFEGSKEEDYYEDYGAGCDCCGHFSDGHDEPNYQNMDYDDYCDLYYG